WARGLSRHRLFPHSSGAQDRTTASACWRLVACACFLCRSEASAWCHDRPREVTPSISGRLLFCPYRIPIYVTLRLSENLSDSLVKRSGSEPHAHDLECLQSTARRPWRPVPRESRLL